MAVAVFSILSGPNSIGDRWVTVVKVTGPSSYSSGGFAVAPEAVGLGFVDAILHGGTNTAGAAYISLYNAQTKKLKAYTGNTEASGDLSSFYFYVICFGT